MASVKWAMKFLLCWLGHGYPCKGNSLRTPFREIQGWKGQEQCASRLCGYCSGWGMKIPLNASVLNLPFCASAMMHGHISPLPACSFWITFPPGIWKSKQQQQGDLCGLAKCEPASLLGKVLGKDILDNRSRCCQYSVLIFLLSATCFC